MNYGHSKGPWVLQNSSSGDAHIETPGEGWHSRIVSGCTEDDAPEGEANLRLILFAPTLLEMAQELADLAYTESDAASKLETMAMKVQSSIEKALSPKSWNDLIYELIGGDKNNPLIDEMADANIHWGNREELMGDHAWIWDGFSTDAFGAMATALGILTKHLPAEDFAKLRPGAENGSPYIDVIT